MSWDVRLRVPMRSMSVMVVCGVFVFVLWCGEVLSVIVVMRCDVLGVGWRLGEVFA